MTAPMYHQEVILAMELDRSHIGKLVQLITEAWSMTGTLTKVDQHDNREWELDYSRGRRLVPKSGEIYAVLTIGPWTGRVVGNQPVTVETVAGTLEAPERAALNPTKSGYLISERVALAATEPPALEGVPLDPPSTRRDVHLLGRDRRFTLCGLRTDPDGRWMPEPLAVTQTSEQVTCRECKRRIQDPSLVPGGLPPEPSGVWVKDPTDPEDPHNEVP